VKTQRISTEGAKEYSPERNAVELRELTPSRPNPCRGVTEIVAIQMRHIANMSARSLAPFQGLGPFYSIHPEFRCAPLRALIPAHPSGALFDSRQE
jgi:hypothetical protein